MHLFTFLWWSTSLHKIIQVAWYSLREEGIFFLVLHSVWKFFNHYSNDFFFFSLLISFFCCWSARLCLKIFFFISLPHGDTRRAWVFFPSGYWATRERKIYRENVVMVTNNAVVPLFFGGEFTFILFFLRVVTWYTREYYAEAPIARAKRDYLLLCRCIILSFSLTIYSHVGTTRLYWCP